MAVEHADEMEVAAMLTSRGSDLQSNGAYGDELVGVLGLSVRVFMCHRVGSAHPGDWHRYALLQADGSGQVEVRDVIARSHAAATAVLVTEVMQRRGLDVPEDLAAMAFRVLSEQGVAWV